MSDGFRRVVVYIDGYNLYHGLRQKRWHHLYWLDLWQLGLELLKPGQSLESVRYFTTRIKGPDDSRRRQEVYLEAVTIGRPRLSVDFGHFLQKSSECHSCHAIWTRHEEKKTDVNIACRLLEDAMDDVYDVAMLVSGDSDLVPPIEVLKRRWRTKRVIAVFPPGRFSDALMRAAHAYTALSERKIQRAQLPDQIVNPSGFVLRRPDYWTKSQKQ